MRRPAFLASLTLASLVLAFLASGASAQSIGAVSPDSAIPRGNHPLRSTEDESTTLNSLMGPNGLVVVFWSNVCPWTERYTDRIVDLARDYQPAGIAFAAVNSNDSTRFPDEDFASMRLISASAGFPFPYLMDDSGAVSIAFGARNTPQVYFFSNTGTLLYEGAIDDSPADPGRVETPYLQLGMDQHLAGQAIQVQLTNALGCTIKLPR